MVVEEVKERLGDRPPELFTSDEHAAYESAIVTAFSEPEPAPASPSRPGRPRVRPRRRLAPGLVYATVRKERKKGRVVSIRRSIVLGDEPTVEALLKASYAAGRSIPRSWSDGTGQTGARTRGSRGEVTASARTGRSTWR